MSSNILHYLPFISTVELIFNLYIPFISPSPRPQPSVATSSHELRDRNIDFTEFDFSKFKLRVDLIVWDFIG